MSARSTPIPSRPTTLLIVAAAHGLALWAIWQARVPRDESIEGFTSTLFFVPSASTDSSAQSTRPSRDASGARSARHSRAPAAATAPEVADDSSAITLPPAAAAAIDWSAQIGPAADAALKKEMRAREQLGVFMRKFVVQDDPRNPGQTANRDFRWYDAGIHRIDTRSWIPVLHVNARCVLIAFIMPACAIGHIDTHGDLFKNMVTVLDESEATARPNDVP